MSEKPRHYGDEEGFALLSHNAILNIVNTNRNYGKTWLYKKRAVARYLKKGRKTLWLRVFKKEAKEAAASFFSSPDLLNYCGLEWYDKARGTGNLKREGNSFFIRRGRRWDWAIKVACLADSDACRSADDVRLDTIILDEYAKTPAKLRRYLGNMVTDFFDIFYSAKREHQIRCFLLGNKEAFHNPFLAYFGITPPRSDWEGIRCYRGGTIAIQQINNKQFSNGYEDKLAMMMAGTSYGNYIDGEVKGAKPAKCRKVPPGTFLWAQFDFDGTPVGVKADGIGNYFVVAKIDRARPVYATGTGARYPRQFTLSNRSKKLFSALVGAFERGAVYYATPAVAEAVQPLLTFLGVK